MYLVTVEAGAQACTLNREDAERGSRGATEGRGEEGHS